ncbi:MAG TPA: hypothetical protein VEB21_13105 [Terriglobales bacterium]|nr:hypothetical protein [Terriglobales bacterium]
MGRLPNVQTEPAHVLGFPEEHLPSTLLHPVQFADIWRGGVCTPERELAAAVIETAAADLRKYRHARGRRRQRFYMEARKWVMSDDRDWPFSFINLCDSLKLSVEALREEMLGDATERQVAEAA